MKQDYWNVSDEEVREKTGKPIVFWMEVLRHSLAETHKTAASVSFLQEKYSVPRYWARTLTTLYWKQRGVAAEAVP